MFEMKIEKQLNLSDRTLLLGVPKFDTIPESVVCGNLDIKVIGVSLGAKLPYLSLETESASEDLVGKMVYDNRSQ